MIAELIPIIGNIIIPLLAGMIFFILAYYVASIAPLRLLVIGEKTYRNTYWGFIFFGIYLATRPLQILLGPHPLPLIINNFREFVLIGFFGPTAFLGIFCFTFGEEKLWRYIEVGAYLTGLVLALMFIITNTRAIGGSQLIFHLGKYPVYDGFWFANPDPASRNLMKILFSIRLLDPVSILLFGGVLLFRHGIRYPYAKRLLYDNLPRKYIFLALSCFSFAFSMIVVALIYIFGHIPNQWWLYYLGALIAGFLETIGLALPVKKKVILSEYQ